MQPVINQPFSNAQLELLKAFSHQLSDSDLLELKKALAVFFSQKLVQEADKIWEDKKWTNEQMDAILNSKLRKKK